MYKNFHGSDNEYFFKKNFDQKPMTSLSSSPWESIFTCIRLAVYLLSPKMSLLYMMMLKKSCSYMSVNNLHAEQSSIQYSITCFISSRLFYHNP